MKSIRPNNIFIDDSWDLHFDNIERYVSDIEIAHPEVFKDENTYMNINWGFISPDGKTISFDIEYIGDIPDSIKAEVESVK
jgi:hypothetical protein